jgi:predicted ATPase
MSYHLIQGIIRSLLGLELTPHADEMHAQLQVRLQTLLESHAELFDQVYPFLAHLLELPLPPEYAARVQGLEASALQLQYVNAMTRALHGLLASRPTIIVCKDLHWADPASVELLSRLLPLVLDLPLLFCLMLRPDPTAPGWPLVTLAREIGGTEELQLSALSEDDSQKLISNLLAMPVLPPAVHKLILSKAEGNPFFVEEVIRMLIDRGVLRREGEGWCMGDDIEQIEIPDTLQGLLMARIDQLPPDVQRTLQLAAVIGREFPLEILLKVLEGDKSGE